MGGMEWIASIGRRPQEGRQEGRAPISAKWVDLVDHTSLAWMEGAMPRVRIAMAATGSE